MTTETRPRTTDRSGRKETDGSGRTETAESLRPSPESEAAPVGFLDPDDCFTRRYSERPFFRTQLTQIDQYELPETDLTAFAGVVVSSQADQDFLYRHRYSIRTYLDEGGVVAFSGHLSRRWLPGAGTFEPKQIDSAADYVVRKATDHPVFDGVAMDDLTYQRGVAGFFARGHNPPPEEATVILRLADGEPVVYVDEATTDGTIFAHSGNDLIAFDRRETSARRVPPQLVAWIRETSDIDVSLGRRRTSVGGGRL